ncbi:hypothetical protein P43SY_007681 [Pythium insidiosum]|uniref:Peptidase S26 domain-containing protein n=1 Tax=Pythium insidiosum TaxID=114742 RepID=A0AAD5LFL7_PYTIN|nr:hypothetical protein P43SY_007681 [Pythium insidiosum]
MASAPRNEVAAVLSYFLRFAGASFCLLQGVDTIKCVGPSMLPTLNRDGDIVLVDKLTPRVRPFERGEVVIAKSVSNPRHTVCKRIIAMEGDTVCVRPRYSSSEVEFHKIPRGHVWLEGDNKHDSHDSRYYGPVPYALLQGRVVMRIWPLNKLMLVKKQSLARNAALVLGWTCTLKLNVCDFIYGIGASMEPTVPNGSLAVIDRLTPHWRQYQRGDVVILRSPTRSNGANVIKRILALEGDTVELQPRFDEARSGRVVVPKGHVWVEGDNATMSVDSRHVGAIPLALVEGRVQAIVRMSLTVRRSTQLTRGGGAHRPPPPPFARLPAPTQPLHEHAELVWNDGVAPETLIDFDAPHIPKYQALKHLGYALAGFASLMGVVTLYDPNSLRQAAKRGNHLPDLKWELGQVDEPEGEMDE